MHTIKRNFVVLIILLFHNLISHVQDFGASGSCHENVNNTFNSLGRDVIISATFKIEAGCTGTLINRNTDDNNLGYYFITAHHCTNNMDLTAVHTLIFNYQSPDDNNNNTPQSNRAESIFSVQQSDNLSDIGYEYLHVSQLRLVEDYFWGDFALCEILTPLPPHFNVSFAGWNPSSFYQESIQIGQPPPCNLIPNAYVGIHHPNGDIKKISGTNYISPLNTPISTGCYTITTAIDVVFGWIWGNQWSTQVICNYVDIPWFSIPYWCHGATAPWSSGSGLFNINNRYIGTLSGGLSGCTFSVADFYGQFRNSYPRQAVKNTLNPSNNIWVDLFGLEGRRITCYDQDLTLPATHHTVSGPNDGFYFPANHYQDENEIVIHTDGDINVNRPINVLDGADYEFRAGGAIDVNGFMDVALGATFTATPNTPCPPQKQNLSAEENLQYALLAKLDEIKIPEKKEFEASKYIRNKNEVSGKGIKIFPNPSGNGEFLLIIGNGSNFFAEGTVIVQNVLSEIIYQSDIGNSLMLLDLSSNSQGVYFLKVITGDAVFVHKLIISE